MEAVLDIFQDLVQGMPYSYKGQKIEQTVNARNIGALHWEVFEMTSGFCPCINPNEMQNLFLTISIATKTHPCEDRHWHKAVRLRTQTKGLVRFATIQRHCVSLGLVHVTGRADLPGVQLLRCLLAYPRVFRRVVVQGEACLR